MPIVVERVLELTSERGQIWCAVADTERMNRAVGLGPLELEPLDDAASAARYVVRTVSGGFALEYEERPFEWVENERFRIHRVLRRGVVRSLTHEFVLEPALSGTRLRFKLEAEPRYALLAPAIKLQVSRFADRIERELVQVDAEIRQGKAACFRTTTSPVDTLSLERAARALDGALTAERQELGRRLAEFVRTAPDSDVVRMRPFELADEWQMDDRELLAVCLAAVKTGLLELSWELVCPSCRTGTERVTALVELPTGGHCQLCDLSFEIELDRAVEATFRPAASLRTLQAGPYCIGGPRRTPHVVSQAILMANGIVTFAAPAEPGRYRLFVRGGASAAVEVTPEAIVGQRFEYGASLLPAVARVAPGSELEIANAQQLETHVKLERLRYASRAATAHVVSTLPEFRREFSSDLLRTGITLRVARVALLFSDLTDSTALYSRVGDARAFKIVHEHFDLLTRAISQHRGALVKTIGDAVMAAFVEERDAIRAAVDMLTTFPQFRAELPEAQRTFLKVGVFAGPCYVVTANGALDYFGQTVNLAARLQGAAGAGEIVLTDELALEAAAQGWLGPHRLSPQFEARLKGVDGPIQLRRVHVDCPV
jgi:class 3 adenylate cyclase